MAAHRAGTVSSGEGKRRVYFRANHCVCWGTLKLPTEIQGDLHGTSNTSPRWRQCCTILTIHCPSPWPPGSYPALEGLHSPAEAAISPTPAFIPPLGSSPHPNRFGSKMGETINQQRMGSWTLTGPCNSRLEPWLLGQNWVYPLLQTLYDSFRVTGLLSTQQPWG